VDGVTLIVGPDELLCEREVEQRIATARAAADGPLQVLRYDAAELEMLPEMRTASLFDERLCVVIRDVDALSGEANRPLREQLEAYLADPVSGNVLILVARSVGRIPTLAKAASAAGEKVEIKPPPEHDGRAWDRLVREEFARLGRKVDADVIAAIRDHAGDDPTAIASQVATVCHATPPGRVVQVADVEAVVSGRGRTSAFAVADAIGRRDPAAALLALRGAMGSGEAPLRIVGALTFRFRQLLQARAGAGASEVGVPPGRLDALRRAAQSFHPGELAWCHDRLARLDLDLKGSDLPDEVLMDIAVVELATSRQPGAPFDPTSSR
jgi:DNA polymerase III subunit delta